MTSVNEANGLSGAFISWGLWVILSGFAAVLYSVNAWAFGWQPLTDSTTIAIFVDGMIPAVIVGYLVGRRF